LAAAVDELRTGYLCGATSNEQRLPACCERLPAGQLRVLVGVLRAARASERMACSRADGTLDVTTNKLHSNSESVHLPAGETHSSSTWLGCLRRTRDLLEVPSCWVVELAAEHQNVRNNGIGMADEHVVVGIANGSFALHLRRLSSRRRQRSLHAGFVTSAEAHASVRRTSFTLAGNRIQSCRFDRWYGLEHSGRPRSWILRRCVRSERLTSCFERPGEDGTEPHRAAARAGRQGRAGVRRARVLRPGQPSAAMGAKPAHRRLQLRDSALLRVGRAVPRPILRLAQGGAESTSSSLNQFTHLWCRVCEPSLDLTTCPSRWWCSTSPRSSAGRTRRARATCGKDSGRPASGGCSTSSCGMASVANARVRSTIFQCFVARWVG
jgi:hypothetical protein